jgi:hypothetical protein
VGGGNCEADHDADVVRHQFGRTQPRQARASYYPLPGDSPSDRTGLPCAAGR